MLFFNVLSDVSWNDRISLASDSFLCRLLLLSGNHLTDLTERLNILGKTT